MCDPWEESLYCVVKDNGEFVGTPYATYGEALKLALQYDNSMIFEMHPFGDQIKKVLTTD